jgi:hypothetical protein
MMVHPMKTLILAALVLALPLSTMGQQRRTAEIKRSPKFAANRPGEEDGVGASTFGLKGWLMTWWVPSRASVLPYWTLPVTVENVNGDIEISAVAPCRGVTSKGLVASGGCFCNAEDQVSESGPVYLNPTTQDFNNCGPFAAADGGPLPCNAWLCTCEDDDALDEPDFAQAQAYCV